MTLDALFKEARRYGKVYIHTHDDGTYSCKIACMTPQSVSLEFNAGYKNVSPDEALTKAIKAAKEYVKL